MTAILAQASPHTARWGLVALGGLSTALWVWVALAMPTSNRPAHLATFLAAFAALFALYLVAVALGRRSVGGGLAGVVFLFAAALRLVAVCAGLPGDEPLAHLRADLAGRRVAYEPFLLYDNDLWRYLWDGHATARGLNPFLVTPSAADEDDLIAPRLFTSESWRDVHDAVSFRNYATIYPPGIHFFFAALARLAPASAGAAKLALAAIDLMLCWLLWRALRADGRPGALTLVYAWNPAVVKEFSGSGHPDVLMMVALFAGVVALARGRPVAGGAAVALSILAKLASIVVLPFLALWALRRRGPAVLGGAVVAGAAVLAAGAWPLFDGLAAWRDALGVFADRWTFNSGAWASIRWLFAAAGATEPERLAHLVTRSATVAAALWIAWRIAPPANGLGNGTASDLRHLCRGVFQTLAVLVLLSPAVMPWYVLWPLPFAVVAGNRWWPAFTGLALLSYLNYADGIGAAAWWKWIEYGTLAVVVVWSRRAAGPRS